MSTSAATASAPSSSAATDDRSPSAFRAVPRTGVIYVMAEAGRAGYRPDDPSVSDVHFENFDLEYAPVAGLWEVREAVAGMYNELFRRGMPSKYSAENVAISGGGRVSIMRACAAIGQINLGHFLPDYTAYAEVLDIFRRFTPIPILVDPEHGYDFSLAELRREILGRGLGAMLMSNPSNPTGKAIVGAELASWVATARELDCTMLMDEFYAHYL
jgi:aspartate/methionine/tyrosine aminotransferase